MCFFCSRNGDCAPLSGARHQGSRLKKNNNKLFASISTTQCSLPFCLQQVIPTHSGALHRRPRAVCSPEAERPALLVGEQNICPGLMSQESDSAPNSVVLSKQLSPADGDPQGTARGEYLPSGGSPACSHFIPPAESWAQSSPI